MNGTLEAKAKADRLEIANIGAEIASICDINFEIPGPFLRLERILAYLIASKAYTGRGCFVELGSFLGASTQAFAAGLKHNRLAPEESKVIDTYDLFGFAPNWDTGYQDKTLSTGEKEDFLPRFQQHMRGLEKYYRAHRANILEVDGPPEGKEIEVIFVDLCKTEEIMIHVAERFLSKVPVGGYYMQQDYLFPGLPFIKAFHEAYWDYFEVEKMIDSTILFRLRKQFDVGSGKLREYLNIPQADKAKYILENGRRFGGQYVEMFQHSYKLTSHTGWHRHSTGA
jgi:hypothetical protein